MPNAVIAAAAAAAAAAASSSSSSSSSSLSTRIRGFQVKGTNKALCQEDLILNLLN